MTDTLGPSDLPRFRSQAAEAGAPSRALLGGRVVRVLGSELWVADAFATVLLQAPSLPVELAPGALVELEIDASGRVLEFVSVQPTSAPLLEFELGRQRALRAVRAYFEARDFLEVETPSFVPCPGLDAHVDSLGSVTRGSRVDHLITSPELHMKRLVVGGLPRIYQIARVFRAEEVGAQHEPEFTLVEWYRAFASLESVLDDVEQLVREVTRAIRGVAQIELRGRAPLDLEPPFLRLRVDEAFRRFADGADALDLAERDEGRYFELLVDRVEPALAALERPVFLTHYPATQAALARRHANEPRCAERSELYVAGVELCNGFGELGDADEQRRRFELELERRRAQGAPLYPLDERFLRALGEGLPPSAGNALGLDRLIALALGGVPIADTYAFADSER
jgi:lysyl-tRNA synthetase class 2